jgi:hypothetical protein
MFGHCHFGMSYVGLCYVQVHMCSAGCCMMLTYVKAAICTLVMLHLFLPCMLQSLNLHRCERRCNMGHLNCGSAGNLASDVHWLSYLL